MDLVFRDNWLNRWEVRDLMAFGIRVVTAEFRTAIAARPGTMMYHPVTRFRRNQRASAFHMPSLTPAFAIGFWLRCAHGLLSRSVARRWQRRIARVHSKSALKFLDSLLLCRDNLILLPGSVRTRASTNARTAGVISFNNSSGISDIRVMDEVSLILLNFQRPI
jgi:hypothetical protein